MEESYPAFLGYLMKESEIEMVAEMQLFLLLQSIYACHAISSISNHSTQGDSAT
jgi:hypothetical protein